MTREEFINFLEKHDIPYSEYTEHGLDQVYVFSKDEFLKKQKHPRKFKDLYLPYLRVSHFDRDYTWYTRDNGYCSYMDKKDVLAQCLELGGLV